MSQETNNPSSVSPEVSFDEFRRVDIRVARVLEASRVPNSSKLVKLILDVGGQKKQCIAGVGTAYVPEQLQDKLIAVVTNMKPRSLMGFVSEVMLLAAGEGPDISVLTFDKSLNTGARVT
jgi:methionyl-tRNA synthetase